MASRLTGLRVLHVIPSVALSSGGPSRAMATIENALNVAGVEVATLTSDDALGGAIENLGGAVRIRAQLWTRRYKICPGMLAYLARNIAKFDVVHIHALFSFSSTVAAWTARWRGVPYVVRPLGVLAVWGTQNRRRWLKRLSLALIEGPNMRAAAAVHFTSEAERSEAEALGLSFRSVVIPLGVEDPGLPVRKAGEGRAVVLFLSRLDPKKNVEALIDAFDASPSLCAAARLRIAGDGAPAYAETLRARARNAGLDDDVEWLGHVDGPRKAAAFAEADIFVLPSFSENFGIAAVEAMLAGLPCLLSPGVAVAGAAAGAHAARLVEPEPNRIAEAVLDLLSHPQETKDLAARSRAFAVSEYSTKVMADRLIELYREVLQIKSCG